MGFALMTAEGNHHVLEHHHQCESDMKRYQFIDVKEQREEYARPRLIKRPHQRRIVSISSTKWSRSSSSSTGAATLGLAFVGAGEARELREVRRRGDIAIRSSIGKSRAGA
jgi:hypothetical protein